VDTAPAITSATDALHLLDSALAYLATADATQLPTAIQARCLTALERADARITAARARNLAAFIARQGYCEDGPGEPMPGPQVLPPGLSRESLEQGIIGKAIELLSGPGGLASFLRRQQLGVRLGGPSQPLDIGYSNDVPAGIRNAVKARDLHCQWAGGCDQPASACEVHHLKHKAHGGETSLDNCILICFYHHQVAIHRMGWTLVRNADGTTTAWNRDRSKVLRSHSPPARAG